MFGLTEVVRDDVSKYLLSLATCSGTESCPDDSVERLEGFSGRVMHDYVVPPLDHVAEQVDVWDTRPKTHNL